MQRCRAAVKNTADNAYQKVKDQTVAWYSDYDPIDGGYHRTYQLHGGKNSNFIMRSGYSSDDSCEEKIELDTNGMYATGKNPTRQQVVDTAAQGLHGVSDGDGWKYVSGYSGVKLWDEDLQSRSSAELVDALRAQGIPIIKG